MASNTETRKVEIITNAAQSNATINQLNAAARLLYNELKKLPQGSREFKETMDKWRDVDKRFKSAQAEVRGLDNEMGRLNKTSNSFWTQIKQVGLGVIAGNIFSFLGAQAAGMLNGMVSAKKKISDEMADIKKTTGLTIDEVKALDKELGDINTRTSRSELRQLAVEAGKLGREGKHNVKAFVGEMNQIKVALGEDLGEDAILQIGKMTNVYEAGALNIASAINAIGASSEASEQYLVDFAARLGGAAKTAKISAPDIIGYGAVLDQMGLQVEMSATALSNFVIDFVKDTGKFEKAAGMQSGSLNKIIGEKGTNEGLIAFIENLKKSTHGQDEFLQALEKVGIDGSRGAAVFLTLSNNLATVREQQALANEEFKKATSITEEYNDKNENFAANMEKLGKLFHQMFADNLFTSAIEDLVGWLVKMTEVPVSETMEEERKSLQGLEYQLYDTNTKHEDRVKIIKELKDRFPEYFKNINAEKATYWEISNALKSVNDQLVNKIIIQRKAEEINKKAEKAADSKAKMMTYSGAIGRQFKGLSDKYSEYDYTVLGPDAIKRGQHMIESYEKGQTKFLGKPLLELPADLAKLKKYLALYHQASNDFREVNKEMQAAEQEKRNLMIDLGISDDEPETKTGGGGNDALQISGKNTPTTKKGKKEKSATDIAQKQADDRKRLIKEEMQQSKEFLEAWNDGQIAIINEYYIRDEVSKERHESLMEAQEYNHLLAMRQLQIDYGEDTAAIDKRISEYKIRSKEKYQKQEVKTQAATFEEEKQLVEAQHNMLLAAENNRYNTGEVSNEDHKLAMMKIDQQYFTDLIALYKAAGLDASALELKLSKLKGTITDTEKNLAKSKGTWEDYTSQVVSTYNSFLTLINTREEAEIASDKRILNSKIELLDKELAAGTITQDTYNKRKEAMNAEYDKKQREWAKRDYERKKNQAMIQAAINTGLGVTRALVDYAYPYSLIIGGLVLASGIAQASTIANQPTPEFEEGGYSDLTGASGRRYKAKRGRAGNYYNTPTYLVGEAGKPEYVIPNFIVKHPAAANIMQALEATVATKNIGHLTAMGSGSDPMLGATLAKLNKHLDEGIIARTQWDQMGYERYMETWTTSKELAKF
jgi:TP901 family phage tail tape measure protein